ncbi:hypothetical protein QZM46_25370 [Burkholderia vietnamiensis]|uniref:hypothetical protein n=1 Tax=Burkholderia vietnamiensis TaxID=60552 RepID=UPI0026535491|nr:hypothetical protein [Burkholderia vietnamiensis]MDN7554645.1 hypothetical protein [Burkholderia vietnamiensis]HDR9176342.1 hypothetical protein [Burkholderia vietnamiensis]
MNKLFETIAAHLAASPKNEIMLPIAGSRKSLFLKADTVKTMTAEGDGVRINGVRYFESQVHYWEA